MKLFRKKKPEVIESVNAKDIHNEAYSAQQIILERSKEIASELIISQDEEALARKLIKMEFNNASNIGKRVSALDKAKAIMWYQENNPYNKFIDDESISKICNKYNLYLCYAEDYIGEIPLKNQREILDFRIKECALINRYRVPDINYNYDLLKSSFEYKKEIDNLRQQRENKIKDMDKSMSLVGCCDLRIIAPESEIDMSRKRKIGHQIIKTDPIVLQPVKWGYLIVTAWGDEASGELVVNEKMN